MKAVCNFDEACVILQGHPDNTVQMTIGGQCFIDRCGTFLAEITPEIYAQFAATLTQDTQLLALFRQHPLPQSKESAMKTLAIACLFALTLCFVLPPRSAQAQIAVTDALNIQQTFAVYAQQVKTVEQEYQSYMKLIDQLTQAKQQFNSITGVRGLGNILIEDYTKVSPTSTSGALNIMGGNDQTSVYAKQYSGQTSQLAQPFFANVPAEVIADLQATMDGHAAQKGANASVYQSAVDRYSRMDNIRAQIECTQDLKAITELQARMQAESMIAQNELVKQQALNAMLQQDEKLQDEKKKQQYFDVISQQYQ